MVSRMSYEIILRDLVVNKNVANKYRGGEMLNEYIYIYTRDTGRGRKKRFEAMRILVYPGWRKNFYIHA